jgi:hypothetical protein
MYKSLVIFLKFWSKFGYWKSQNALDFSTSKFIHLSFWLYIASGKTKKKKKKKKNCAHKKQFNLSNYGTRVSRFMSLFFNTLSKNPYLGHSQWDWWWTQNIFALVQPIFGGNVTAICWPCVPRQRILCLDSL